jgi:hypothetical protein
MPNRELQGEGSVVFRTLYPAALELRQCPNIAREVVKIDQSSLSVANMLKDRDDITKLRPAIHETMAGCFFRLLSGELTLGSSGTGAAILPAPEPTKYRLLWFVDGLIGRRENAPTQTESTGWRQGPSDILH